MHHQSWHLQHLQLQPPAPAGNTRLVLPLALTLSALRWPPLLSARSRPPSFSPSHSHSLHSPPAPARRKAGQATPSTSGAESRAAEKMTESGQASQGWGADGQGDLYVWYASYGSNMWEDRFLCYIRGGKMEGMSRSCPGSSDPTPPVASTWVAAPHRSWFGRTRTATWGDGGVCFLDPLPWPSREGTLPTAPNAHADSASDDAIDANSTSSNDTSTNGTSASGIDRIRDSGTVDNSANVGESETQHHTLLRLHKIRLQQFNDVVAQENMMHFSQQPQPQPPSGPSPSRSSNPTDPNTPSTAQDQGQTCAPSPSPASPPPLVPLSLILRLRSQPLLQSASASQGAPDSSVLRESTGNQEGNGSAVGAPSFRSSVEGMLPPVSAPAYEEVIPGGWYGTVLYLGDLEGSPILTFTCNAEDATKFYRGKLPVNAPSPTYHAVVGRGLEMSGMSQDDVEEYIKVRAHKLHKH